MSGGSWLALAYVDRVGEVLKLVVGRRWREFAKGLERFGKVALHVALGCLAPELKDLLINPSVFGLSQIRFCREIG